MILTIDASVAVKWIVDEPGSAQAFSYLPRWEEFRVEMKHIFLAPSLLAIELHHTIAKRHRRGEVTFTQLAEAEYALENIGTLHPLDDDLINTARFMSFVAKYRAANAEGRPQPDRGTVFNIYDCIYIAHAKRHNTTLLTADREQAQVAMTFEVPVEFVSAE